MNSSGTNSLSAGEFAAARRSRLTERLRDRRLNGALITDPREIMYFTGTVLSGPAPACLLVRIDGESALVCGEGSSEHHVDRVEAYPWHVGGTIHGDLVARLADVARATLRVRADRLGFQRESAPSHLVSAFEGVAWTPIDGEIAALERSKDALDLKGISGAIEANLAALAAAEQAIVPGASEIEVFAAACRGATLRAGVKILHDGDYRCSAMGGPARDRAIETGALYIIDAWTSRSGYWSDLSRVFCVGARPAPEQAELIDHVSSIHSRVLPLLRPGTRTGELWRTMDAMMRELPGWKDVGLVHHGGHGVGVRLHELPDINPGVDDELRVGDVVCIEPGGYFASGAGGARIEETYVITAQGAACLSKPKM